MTSREELRTKAILTLAAANFDYQKPAHARAFSDMPATIRLMLVEKMGAAFDALGDAGFHVLGPEVTEEMGRANGELPHNVGTGGRFVAMARAGDLTKK